MLTHSICPFCRSPPTFTCLKQYNPRLAGIEGRCQLKSFDPNYYHAWCLGCGKVNPALDRKCAGDEIPHIQDFTCETCIIKQREKMREVMMQQTIKMGLDGKDPNIRYIQENLTIIENELNKQGISKEKHPKIFWKQMERRLEKIRVKEKMSESKFFAMLLSNGGKSCPSCNISIEKLGGCNHMTCGSCGCHFCWLCLKSFHGGGDTYDHLNSSDNNCKLYTN